MKAPTAVARGLGDIHVAERPQVAVRTFEDAWHACCVGPLQGFQANLRERIAEIGTCRRDHRTREASDAAIGPRLSDARETPERPPPRPLGWGRRGRMPRDVGQSTRAWVGARAGPDRMDLAAGQRQGAQGVARLSAQTAHPYRRAIDEGDGANAHETARPLRGPRPGQPRKQRRQAGGDKRRQRTMSQSMRHDRHIEAADQRGRDRSGCQRSRAPRPAVARRKAYPARRFASRRAAGPGARWPG